MRTLSSYENTILPHICLGACSLSSGEHAPGHSAKIWTLAQEHLTWKPGNVTLSSQIDLLLNGSAETTLT